MPEFSDKVRIRNVKVVKATDKALLVRLLDEDDREEWIPQSQIDADSEVYQAGDVGDLVVSQWIAEQKGLE